MKVEVMSESEQFRDEYDYRSFYVLSIDGEEALRFLDGEPEDANLSRDYSDIYVIHKLLERAHASGAKGESFHLRLTEGDEFP